MTSTTKRVALAALAGTLTVPLLAQGAASADSRTGSPLHFVRTLSKSLVAPLQFVVAGKSIYVGDSGIGLRKLGGPTLVRGPSQKSGGDISGVAVNTDNGDIAYTTTLDGSHKHTRLTVLRHGKAHRITSLAGFERVDNPDGHVLYGVPNPDANKCATAAYEKASHGPANYRGQVDSHPYAVAYLGHGAYAVADAGGNDIVRVNAQGTASKIAVLPRQAFTVTKAFAVANKLPDCVIGFKFFTESVPTDVEVGPGGNLLVTTLPGGPEGPGVGPRGSVYVVDPKTHKISLVASGFNNPVNVAVNGAGHIYVAELGANRVSTIVNGKPKPVFHVTAPAGLEAANGKIYVSTAPIVTGSKKPGKLLVLGYGAS